MPVSPAAASIARSWTRGSIRTSIVPPQARPTSHACSSLMPYRITRERPSLRARSISSAAAPSTQPPLTEPAIRPSSASRRTAPSGRGADPNVRITTARPNPTPSVCQVRIVSTSSFMATFSQAAERPTDPSHARAGPRARGRRDERPIGRRSLAPRGRSSSCCPPPPRADAAGPAHRPEMPEQTETSHVRRRANKAAFGKFRSD